MDNNLDIGLASPEEICKVLGARLKAQRLAQSITQAELAARAGVSAGTVKNLESSGQSSMDSVVRIGLVLGLTDDLQALFALKVKSIAQMEMVERSKRLRASRKKAR